MALSHNSKISSKNLVFSFDRRNFKSYKGPPIKNIFRQITNNNVSASGVSITSGTENVYIPTIGYVTSKYSLIQNNYPSVSTNCCPSPFTFGNGYTVSPSTLYTYGIVYKIESEYTNSNYMYRYEYTSNGGSKTIEQGVHNNSNRVHLGNGWYWAWGTFTTQATTQWIGYTGFFYYRYSSTPDRAYVAKAILVEGDYSGLHPKYWPELDITRTTSEVIYDITNKNQITSNSLTYDNNGNFSFNGTNNFISFPENSLLNSQTLTVDVWAKTNATSQNGFWFEKGTVNTQYSLFQEGGSIRWRANFGSGHVNMISITTSNFINTTDWFHIAATFISGQQYVYINGNQVGSNTLTGTIATNTNGCSIGVYGGFSGSRGYYYNGNIDSVKVYNRALSDKEIQQNFNTHRRRYL